MSTTKIKGYWTAGAVETEPNLETLKSRGYPTDGDKRRGTPPTVPGAAWFHLMDRMRTSVLEASGVQDSDPLTDVQFINALKSFKWADGATTLDGLVLKTGTVDGTAITNNSITTTQLSRTLALGVEGAGTTLTMRTYNTTTARNKVTPAAGEIIYDKEAGKFFGGNGSTKGGINLGGASLPTGIVTDSNFGSKARTMQAVTITSPGAQDDATLLIKQNGSNGFVIGETKDKLLYLNRKSGDPILSVPERGPIQVKRQLDMGNKKVTKVATPSENTDATTKQYVDNKIAQLGAPVGCVCYFHDVPTGWLLCNGASVQKSQYAGLFTKIGTKYGGNGRDTFNLPNLNGRFIEGTTVEGQIGTLVEAGLPNITGRWTQLDWTKDNKPLPTSGAVQYTGPSNTIEKASNDFAGKVTWNVSFDASRVSSLYGRSTTVQPPAVKLYPCIRF